MKKLYSLILSLCVAGVANAQYCTPTYASSMYATGGCTYAPIYTLMIPGAGSTMLFDSLGCTGTGYEDRSGISWMTATLTPGSSYSATLTSSVGSPKNLQFWIDADTSGTFDSLESIGGMNSWTSATGTVTLSIPSTFTPGTYRMRMVEHYAGVWYPNMPTCTMGSNYGDVRDYTVTIGTASSSSGCTGTPSGGSALAIVASGCASRTVNLSTSGATSGSGMTYQWKESTDGGSTWGDISGATTTSTSVGRPGVTTLYKCIATCSSSSLSGSSTVATLSGDVVSGGISFSGSTPDTVSLYVWLIEHDMSAGTLTAVDSTMTCVDSGYAYYEFNGVAAGSYRVKAQSLDVTSSAVGSTGYVPTYGTSSVHWSGASVVSHSAGVFSTQFINMAMGTVTSGPGFIGGLISSGAGKGTAGDVPAVGMLVFLLDASGNLASHAYTNATGAYSFSGIATGTYRIFPEKMNDSTVYAPVTITTSSPSVTAVNFKEYTTSKIIKPVTVSVPAISAAEFAVYPNPTNGNINVKWNEQATGNASVIITDVTGRTVYQSVLDINTANGSQAVNLPALNSGIYSIRINSATINYSDILSVQH